MLAAFDGSVGKPHYQQSTETRRRGDNKSDRNDHAYRHCAKPRLRPSRARKRSGRQKGAYAHTSDYSRMRQLTATVMRSLRGHSALADLSGDRGLPSGEI